MRIDLSQNSVMLSVNPERAAATLRAFAARGIGAPRIVEGWKVSHTPHKAYSTRFAGIALNMLEVMLRAQREGLPYVIVYENDAFPRLKAQEMLDDLLAAHPLPEDCGLLSLGDIILFALHVCHVHAQRAKVRIISWLTCEECGVTRSNGRASGRRQRGSAAP